MKRCIIHFGMHKTGSTSIQQTLFDHAQHLKNIYYLHSNQPNSSIPIITAFGDNPVQYFWNRRQRLTEDQVKARAEATKARLTTQLQTSEKSDFLLSGEGISLMGEAALTRLVAWLTDHVDLVEAVGYIRAPASFMASSFQQLIKGAQIPADWSELVPRYRQRFQALDQVLGQGHVQFWKFDPASFPGGCVVRDFCARLNIDLPETWIVRMNEGLSRDAVALLYAYRKHQPDDCNRPVQPLLRLLAALPGPKLQFSAPRIREALALRQDDIAWMENRLGASLDELITDQPNAVHNEADLFHFSPESVHWLEEQLAATGHRTRLSSQPTPEHIAEYMRILALQVADNTREAPRKKPTPALPPMKQAPISRAANKIFLLGVGCQKGGTSWLHAQLAKHPAVNMGFAKEYHVFDTIYIEEHQRILDQRMEKLNVLVNDSKRAEKLIDLISFCKNPDNYFDYFDDLCQKSDQIKIVGDLTPAYAGLPVQAFELIKTKAENKGFTVKVIFLMRDPFEKIWSNIRMGRRKAINKNPQHIFNSDENKSILNQYNKKSMEFRTRYETTISNLENVFDSSNIFCGFYEKLFTEKSAKLIQNFLEISNLNVDFNEKVNASPKSEAIIETETIKKVVDYYKTTYLFCAEKFADQDLKTIWTGYQYL